MATALVDYTVHPKHVAHIMKEARGLVARNTFAVSLALFQAFVVTVFFYTTSYGDSTSQLALYNAGLFTEIDQYYPFFTGVAFMIFIGFGFLMSFLRRYSFSAIGYNMLISSASCEWGILCMAFFHAIHTHHFETVVITIPMLIEGLFAAGAVMITFGVVLGKATPTQLLVIAFIEIIIYSLNFFIGALTFGAVDVGGSIFVHMFGAYFGLACAWMLPPKKGTPSNEWNSSRITSDLTAMFGTIFLWLLWPSFNGALAPAGSQFRVVVNTVLALNGSCVAAFFMSRLVSEEGKFDMVHIQNATLAGGVAVGSSADLVIGPGGAILIGMIAGIVSVVGYHWISPWMKEKWGLDDTCGVHNLHGMPGLMGGIGGTISCAVANPVVYGLPYSDLFGAGRSPSNQPVYQILAVLVCLGTSIVGGAATGKLVDVLSNNNPSISHGDYATEQYQDECTWEVCHDFEEC